MIPALIVYFFGFAFAVPWAIGATESFGFFAATLVFWPVWFLVILLKGAKSVWNSLK